MVTKQIPGIRAPDGSTYVTVTDGAGNLTPVTTSFLGTKQRSGNQAPDGSEYITITDGNNNLT